MSAMAQGAVRRMDVHFRALKVHYLAAIQTKAFRSTARLTIIAAYSILFMWGGFFEWAGRTELVLWTAFAILWALILVIFVREAMASPRRLQFVINRAAFPLLLIAPLFLLFTRMPIVSFLIVVVAYVLELRYHSAGDGFVFSFGLVLFVGVFAGLSMVEIENEQNSGSALRSPQDALFWAFASLLRINYGASLAPQTHDGRVLATVVGVCAVLGASLFTAQVVSWVVGSRRDRETYAEMEGTPIPSGSAPADVNTQLAEIRKDLAMIKAQLEQRDPSQ